MTNLYIKSDNIFVLKPFSDLITLDTSSIVWIDLLNPSEEELSIVSERFSVEFPTQQERESIESSSRYWEDSSSISINAFFLVSFFFSDRDREHCNESVSFIIQGGILFSLRYKELKSFSDMEKRLLKTKLDLNDGYDVFMQIFDLRIEADADLIEYAAKEINSLREEMFASASGMDDDAILKKISTIQTFNLRIRETISDKRRISVGLLKSNKMLAHKNALSIMAKDINSLIEFTTINLNALDNLQNLFLGQINIDQNKIIKLFAVVNVALMPPTLIASVYGMNFKFIPELSWQMGYPYSIVLMVLSALLPLWYFKKKKWL
jgi:magnesium transporter